MMNYEWVSRRSARYLQRYADNGGMVVGEGNWAERQSALGVFSFQQEDITWVERAL